MKLYLQPYKKYLNSHNEWVEYIPAEWSEKRVKDLFRLVTDIAPQNNDYELLSLYTSIGVKPRRELEARGNKAISTDGYWIVKKGDIIVNKLLAWMGAIGLSEYEGVTSPAYDILRKTNPLIDERFFTYLFRTEKAQQIFKKYSRGIMDVRLRLYFDKFGAILVPVPPANIQKIISDYLDTKTCQIDRKIDLLTKKAAKYSDLKEALINKTVTCGLDKTVTMKYSGDECIREIPKHWEVKRFKEIFTKTHTGWTPDTKKSNNFEGENIWVTIGDMDKRYIYNSINKLSNEAIKKTGIRMTPKGSLLFSFKLSIGKIAIAGCNLYTNEAIISIEDNKKFNLRYFYYALPVLLVLNAKENIYGAKLLNQGLMFNTKIFCPPQSEQKAIADYLDEKTTHIDRIIEIINTEIEKLKELRKTLINDVVNGKIKVPIGGE